ncbi:MAG: hypothetical protein KDD41_13435 [Flavobacteriales bacterium]|nr:hypothetical protein [Flavobacteriales bacterium]
MKFTLHILFPCLGFLLSITTLTAQEKKFLVLFNDTNLKASRVVDYNRTLEKEALKSEVSGVLDKLHRQAYLTARLDSILTDSSSYTAYFALGSIYKWNYLRNKNIDEEVLSKIGFRDKFYNNRPFSADQLKKLFNRVISYYENHGYPFASVKLDSISILSDQLTALLSVEKNRMYTIDSIVFKGDATISPQYIKNYIRIKEGDPYSEESIRKLSTKIRELPFVAEEQPWKMQFKEEESKLYLFLKKKQASRFNGILGVLPDDETGKLRLTGDVKLNLINSFRNGEKISFNWRAIQENTQDLKFDLVYPFLFNSPFGLDYNFKLYKKDTTFIDVGHKIGVRYLLKGSNYFSVFFHNKTSNLLSTKSLANLSVLPAYADVNSKLYGVGIYQENLDYILNPTKGYQMEFSGSLGDKTIRKNPALDEKLYENLNLKTSIYNAELKADFYIPLSKRNVFKLATKNGYTFNENLFQNELLRIGGFYTLRGFDEESIYASLYTIETLEYRFILERNSYFFAFFDGAYYENEDVNDFVSDRPFGFGTGMSFETKAGIFSISYALGKQFDNPILFRSAKIHFGFVNYF